MKRAPILLLSALSLLTLIRPTECAKPIHKVLVWVIAKDADRAQKLEFQYREELANRGIPSDGWQTLFPSSKKNSSEIVQAIQQQGFDSLLCVRSDLTIRWSTPEEEKARKARMASLPSFMKANRKGLGQEPGESAGIRHEDPFEVGEISTQGAAPLVPATGRQGSHPIPDSGMPSWEVFKAGVFLFDVSQEKSMWHHTVPVKVAKDLPLERFYKAIVEQSLTPLTQAGYIPASKRKKRIF